MGRCYEFGLSIDPSSELAMVVAPQGGHCVCPSTGATCAGRFAGCTAILSQPGRIPPNAPDWALGISPAQAPSGQPQPAHTQPQTADLIPQPISGAHTEAGLAEVSAALDSLTDQVAQLAQRPQSATIEDLAEAVVLLRTEQGDRADTHDVTNIEQTLHELAISVSSIAAAQPDGTLFEESMQKLGRAILELRGSTSDALGALRATQATAADSLDGLRDEVRELARVQQREMHILRLQITDMHTRTEQRRGTDLSGEHLLTAVNEMKLDLTKLQPESPEMVSATELADTINTLRDAGVDDISAAHLIHALQGDLRSISGEVQSVHDRIDAMSADVPIAVEKGIPQNA